VTDATSGPVLVAARDHELIYPPVQEFWDALTHGTG
jgi:hypothetical protein